LRRGKENDGEWDEEKEKKDDSIDFMIGVYCCSFLFASLFVLCVV